MLVRNRKTFHETMKTNGWYVPSVNSALCSMEWMQGVRDGTYYCPKLADLKPSKVCLAPPPKSVLLDKITDTLILQFSNHNGPASDFAHYQRTLHRMIKHPGDTEWLVNFLAIADEDDEIFDRKYRYVK